MSHPAIRKLLQVKWKLFGRRQAFIKSFWSVIHTALATILTFAIPYASFDKQFSPVTPEDGEAGYIWKIILAVLFFILTCYFAIKVSVLVALSSTLLFIFLSTLRGVLRS